MTAKIKTVVVCGGGGVWGVAWMTGLAAGLAEAGVNLKAADKFIGTSAGSVVSTHLTSALDIETLFQRQVDPTKQPPERAPPEGRLEGMTALLQAPWGSPEERLAALCELAMNVQSISPAERRADIVARLSLPSPSWPTTPLAITAVDVERQSLTVFDAQSGVDLVDAVTASCAVPGVWPFAEISGRRFTDGGVWRNAENAHLAQGAKRVLILSPLGRLPRTGLDADAGLAADVSELEASGAEVLTVYADPDSLAALRPHPLDPATRRPGAEAGRRQGVVEAQRVRRLFT